MHKKFLFLSICLLCGIVATHTTAQNEVEISTRLEVSSPRPMLVYELKNSTTQPAAVDRIGVGSSQLFSARVPEGDSAGSSIIVEWTQPPPLLPVGESYRKITEAEEGTGCAVGLYIKWLRVKGKDTEKVAIYREAELPCIDGRFGEDRDSIRVVTDLIQQGRFEVAQRQRRQQQLEAFEGMKQYVMVNPYILALSADGKPGFRLKLMATNNTQAPFNLPELNTPKNRIEIVGFNKDNVWSYPQFPLRENRGRLVELRIGETHSWVQDIGRYIEQKGIRRAGRYTIRWLIEDKEVANFVFYLPEKDSKQTGEE